MTAALAARESDIIKHSSRLLGFFAGAVAAVVIGLFVVGTGGLGLGAIAALAAVGGAVGLGTSALIEAFMDNPGITTGALGKGSVFIQINGLDAAAVLDMAVCYWPVVYNHGPKAIVEGSGTVFFGCRPAARKGDALLCGAKIARGSSNVLIGGPTVRIKGTQRSWIDTVLDYSSLYLTVIFAGTTLAGFAASAVVVAISEVLSAPSAVPTVVGGVTSTTADNAVVLAKNLTAERLATANFLAGQAAAQNAMYQAYVKGKMRKNVSYLGMDEWLKNNRVNWALKRRTPPRASPTPKKLGSWKTAGMQILAQLTVDVVRNWRETERENAIPKSVCCADMSWLEPA